MRTYQCTNCKWIVALADNCDTNYVCKKCGGSQTVYVGEKSTSVTTANHIRSKFFGVRENTNAFLRVIVLVAIIAPILFLVRSFGSAYSKNAASARQREVHEKAEVMRREGLGSENEPDEVLADRANKLKRAGQIFEEQERRKMEERKRVLGY